MNAIISVNVGQPAAVVALKSPIGGMVLICLCLIVYLLPEAPDLKSSRDRPDVDGSARSTAGVVGPPIFRLHNSQKPISEERESL
jgi:hypothetical protein